MKRIVFPFLLMLTVSVQAQTLKVMTYNVRFDNPTDGVNQWTKRIDKVTSLIRKYDPSLIGVQEALHHQLEDIITELPKYAYVGVGRDDGKEKGEYSAILYNKEKFEVLKTETKWLSETPDVPGSKNWDAAITRVVTFAQFREKSSGATFFHLNTHYDHIGRAARSNSSVIILGLINSLTAKEKIPVLLSGDFNAEPSEEAYQRIAQSKSLFDTRPADSTTGTYCTFEVNSIECRLIDYIFHSKEWKVKKYEVIRDNDGKYYPSDHLPVLVEVELIP